MNVNPVLMKLNRQLLLIVVILVTLTWRCENPLSEEKKKQQVLLFIDDYFPEIGRYFFYWDGKDENRKYVNPGRYIVLLEIKDFQDQHYITIEEGGKPNQNDKSHFEPGFWTYTELEPTDPNPFKVQSGTNIIMRLSEPSRVKIRIYKD